MFKIDGATTCTIASRFVPNAPMYLKMDMFVRKLWRPCKGQQHLPWTTLVDYLKVTQGSSTVFADDFNTTAKPQPARPASKPKKSEAH